MNNRIKLLRKGQRLTQSHVAQMIGTSQPNLTKMEAGTVAINDYWATRLAAVFRCHPGEIFAPLPATIEMSKCEKKALEYCNLLPKDDLATWLTVAEGFLKTRDNDSR